MTYDPRPKPSGDTLVSSRNPIRTNFEIIQNRFEVNHTAFGSGTGLHKFIQMPEQASAPSTAANQGGLFTREDQRTSGVLKTSLIYREESNGFNSLVIPCRMAASFTVGAVGVQALSYQFNVHSVNGINKTADGQFKVNFQNNLPSTHYIPIISLVNLSGSQDNRNLSYKIISRSVGNFTFETRTIAASALRDPDAIMITVFGG